MSNKKGDKDMQTDAVTESITDMSLVLSLKQVHNYTDEAVARGRAEYNKGSILVRSQHPLDQCLRRGIIEDEHHEIGKRLRNYRDCAVSKLSGRTYNATGVGDSEMDAATIYANVMRIMCSAPWKRNAWKLIETVCFCEPKIDGRYFSEIEYSMLFGLSGELRSALETADGVIRESRTELKQKIDSRLKENSDG
jgi:hypothetical protein